MENRTDYLLGVFSFLAQFLHSPSKSYEKSTEQTVNTQKRVRTYNLHIYKQTAMPCREEAEEKNKKHTKRNIQYGLALNDKRVKESRNKSDCLCVGRYRQIVD